MAEKNTRIFEEMSPSQAVMTMAVPAIAGQLIVLFYNMADTFFVGRTGNPYMVAGASLILPVFNIALSLAGLAGIGGGALISRLLGSKNPEEAQKVFSFSIWLGTAVAALFSFIMLVFMKPILTVLGAGSQTYEYACSYALCVIVCGAIPTVLSNTLAHLLRSIGESGKAGLGVTMGGLINIALDPLMMFVIMPKGMEITGAGLATVISNCLSCLYFAIVIHRLKDGVLKLRSPLRFPSAESIKSVFGVGLPSSIVTFLFDYDYIVLDKLMSGYGDFALAAIGIVLKAERLPLNVGVGICQGMVPIVAYNYSAKNYDRMNKVKRFALLFGLCVGLFSIVLYELFASSIMRVFIDNETTVKLGTVFLKARCIATPLMFFSFFHVHVFNGLGCGKYSLLLGLARWLVFNIPMLFILNRLVGMNGLVWSQAAADFLNVILSFCVYRRFAYKNGLLNRK